MPTKEEKKELLKDKYPFNAHCTSLDKTEKKYLDTKNPDGETCIICGGTPGGDTGKVCYPTLNPEF